ncbi:MAG: arsenite efflux transporter metallochaperone ArsD [Desulfurivibrionaceae bacterium]
MKKILIFDPPLCCPTGVCGPSVDPKLSRFAADLDWLKKKGVTVERFNLAQQPGAFAANTLVRAELAAKGNSCLPLILIDGVIAAAGGYPGRKELAQLAGVDYDPATDADPGPHEAFTLPMADAGACCPAPDDGETIAADGDYCPWPRNDKGGCC